MISVVSVVVRRYFIVRFFWVWFDKWILGYVGSVMDWVEVMVLLNFFRFLRL